MERRLSIPVGIIVESRTLDGPWESQTWHPVGAIIGPPALPPGSQIRREGTAAAYFAGTAQLNLYPAEVASYRQNLQEDVPRLYVVLTEPEEHEPPSLHLVTAAPDEAESYLDGDPNLVDGVPMPQGLIELIDAYVREHDPEPTAAGEASGRRFRQATCGHPEGQR